MSGTPIAVTPGQETATFCSKLWVPSMFIYQVKATRGTITDELLDRREINDRHEHSGFCQL